MTGSEIFQSLWSIVRLPLQIILTGLAIIVVVLIARFVFPGIFESGGSDTLFTGNGATLVVGTLVFLLGIAAFAFLWWLVKAGYDLLGNRDIDDTRLQSLNELPLGLPEGTVRAVLALIVGMVGIPLLLFSAPLGIPQGTAGMIATIVSGVFAYYFGSRVAGGSVQTARNLSTAVGQLQTDNSQLQQDNTTLKGQSEQLASQNQALAESASTGRKTALANHLTTLSGYVAVLDVLVNTLQPVLPKGLLPAGLDTLLGQAKSTLDTASQLADGDITDETISKVTGMIGSIASASPLGGLLKAAAPLLGPLAAGAGPLGAVAMVLTVGWGLTESAYKRWCARVLNAPFQPNLVDVGSISAASAALCLSESPIFNAAFAGLKDQPGFYAGLLNAVLADHAATDLWAKYGPQGLFTDLSQVQQGLDEFRKALLNDASAGDISASVVQDAARKLASGGPDVQPGNLGMSDLDKAINDLPTAAGTDDQKAALDALVLLSTTMHDKDVDIGGMIADLSKAGGAQ
ncbi:hypothetical protein [Rhodopila sp.]|uniref:hypothetical protein n=1 Tax=Rhodopila sp. TaxID=2480087 RepID=UPI002BBF393C|nr:hypothetical protein [Rhodopila sp.]HVZ10255.1 hypothetical protein [Rhodopila sp.]